MVIGLVSIASFTEARSFVRSLKLSSQKEWVKYCKGATERLSPETKGYTG